MADMDKKEQILHDHRIIRKTNLGTLGLWDFWDFFETKMHAILTDSVLTSYFLIFMKNSSLSNRVPVQQQALAQVNRLKR